MRRSCALLSAVYHVIWLQQAIVELQGIKTYNVTYQYNKGYTKMLYVNATDQAIGPKTYILNAHYHGHVQYIFVDFATNRVTENRTIGEHIRCLVMASINCLLIYQIFMCNNANT